MKNDQTQQQEEQAEAEESHRKRRKIDNFLILARNAQNASDKHEQEKQRLLDEDRKAWDEAIEQIRRNLCESHEFDR